MSSKEYDYVLIRKTFYNVNISIFIILYYILIKYRNSTIKKNFDLRSLIQAKYVYIRGIYGNKQKYKVRTQKYPFGHIGIKVRGSGVRIFNFKNNVVYRNQMELWQMKYINQLPYTAKILGNKKEFYLEEFIPGITLEELYEKDPSLSKKVYNKYFKKYLIYNINNNSLRYNLHEYIVTLKIYLNRYIILNKTCDKKCNMIGILLKYVDELNEFKNINLPLVLSHGDTSPKNFIRSKDGIRLIDSECIKYRFLFYDLYDYYYHLNGCIDDVNINPRIEANKDMIRLLRESKYFYDEIYSTIFWKLYKIERMILLIGFEGKRNLLQAYQNLSEFDDPIETNGSN